MKEIFFAVLFLMCGNRSHSCPLIHDGGDGGAAGRAGQGGFFSPAAVLKKSTFAVGFEPQYFFDADYEYGFFGHLRYGILPRLELNSMIGVYNAKLYTGFGGSYQAVYAREGIPGLTFRANYFFNDDEMFGCENGCGIDADMILGQSTGGTSWYGGLNIILRKTYIRKYDPNPARTDAQYEYNLIGGVHYLMIEWVGLSAEFGVNVNDKKTSRFSAGTTFYFGK
ncbi:hypothetical protein JNL27_09645 [bacterium]|nr:hypothetical protein [bacterium]